ncbi:MAG: hypothetical protein QXR30_02135 [Candidatus Woesearchaeota archaeon]
MNQKEIFQYALVFILILGIVLLFLTIYVGIVQYSKMNYQQSLQRNLAVLRGLENVGMVCEAQSEIQKLTISGTKSIYFENPSNLISVNIRIKPKNQLQEVGFFTYLPLFLLSIFFIEDNSPTGIKVSEDETLDEALCNKVDSKKYIINITNLKNEIVCDEKSKLTKSYGFGCLSWKDGDVFRGELGERLSCEQEILENKNCENPIIINSYEDIKNYLHYCKNFCFEIPSTKYCTATGNVINKYFIKRIFKWLKENTQVFEIYKGTTYAFRYNKEQEKTINYDLQFNNLLNDFSFSFNQTLYNSFLTQLRLLETHFKSISSEKKELRKILLIVSNTNAFNSSFCEFFKTQNVYVVLLKLSRLQKIPETLKLGCNEIELDVQDLKNLNEALNIFYDDKIYQAITSKNILVQWNPKNPEFFSQNLKEEKEINIKYTEQLKDLPLTISVNGVIDIELNVTRTICKAVLKS